MTVAEYVCKNCQQRFKLQILSDKEREEAKRDRRPVVGIQCPHCGGQDLQRIK